VGTLFFVVCHISNNVSKIVTKTIIGEILLNKIEQIEKSSIYGENHTTKAFKSSKYQ